MLFCAGAILMRRLCRRFWPVILCQLHVGIYLRIERIFANSLRKVMNGLTFIRS